MLDDFHALGFAVPIQAKSFLARFDPFAQDPFELIEVDHAFREDLWKCVAEAALDGLGEELGRRLARLPLSTLPTGNVFVIHLSGEDVTDPRDVTALREAIAARLRSAAPLPPRRGLFLRGRQR